MYMYESPQNERTVVDIKFKRYFNKLHIMAAAYRTCTEITDDLIPDGGTIVFDWDNTLKLYDPINRQISSRVEKINLRRWRSDKNCDMYVISAIYPSRINLETLLFEVGKLGLLEFFTKEEDKLEVKAGKFARKGNIIICGYDKAEMFLEVTSHDVRYGQQNRSVTDVPEPLDYSYGDVVDSADTVDGSIVTPINYQTGCCVSGDETCLSNDQVVFFDDEEINIINFSALVTNSKCFLVK